MRPDDVGSGGFDSHTLPPRARRWLRRALMCAVVFIPGGVFAQDSLRITPVPIEQDPRIRPPISPRRAFLTSLVIPGLAQARLNRTSGLLFVGIEAVGLTMYAKSSRDLALARSFGRDSAPLTYVINASTGQPARDSTGALVVETWTTTRYGPGRIRARKTHVEDWIALLAFNHLIAATDAFVAAQLWDLPARVSLRVTPRLTTITARIPW